jgi:hypothetical protein
MVPLPRTKNLHAVKRVTSRRATRSAHQQIASFSYWSRQSPAIVGKCEGATDLSRLRLHCATYLLP